MRVPSSRVGTALAASAPTTVGVEGGKAHGDQGIGSNQQCIGSGQHINRRNNIGAIPDDNGKIVLLHLTKKYHMARPPTMVAGS